jgi:hypothetical protein
MDSQGFARGEVQGNKSEIDPAIYRLFKKMMVEILSEQAEASFRKVPTKEEVPVVFPMNDHGNSGAGSSKANRGSNRSSQDSQSSNLEESGEQKGKLGKTQDQPLRSSPQQKGKNQEKPKRKDWSRDREFTPLDKPLDKVLEYMLTKRLVRLPKATSPPTIMGRFRDQFCNFHRAAGHDTDHCFVLKNIVQDCVNKNLFTDDGKGEHPVVLVEQGQSSSQKGVGIRQKSSKPKKAKHDGWGYDRNFTPLGQPMEAVLGYLLTNDMIELPKIVDPSVTMGKWTDKFCKFHRTVGHDAEHCFVLKNIIQDFIDKEILVPEEEEEQSAVPT